MLRWGKGHEQTIVVIQSLEFLEQKVFDQDEKNACFDTMSEFIIMYSFVHQAECLAFFSWLLLVEVTQDTASHQLKQKGKKTETLIPIKRCVLMAIAQYSGQLHREE